MAAPFKTGFLAALALMLFSCSTALARLEPSFHLEQVTWDATHIVVVARDLKREGALRVAESWKGDLEPDSAVPAGPARVRSPLIYDNPLGPRERKPLAVSGERMVLFLVKKVADDGKVSWAAAEAGLGAAGDLSLSTICLEDEQSFAIQQWKNPGPARMHPLRLTIDKDPFYQDLDEPQLKKEVQRLVTLQKELQAALKIEDPGERAKALRPLLQAKCWHTWHEGFPALRDCGRAAVGQWCELLKDETLLTRHADILKQLARFDGPAVSAEMVDILKQELAFWKRQAPELPEGWRGGKDIAPQVAESVQTHNLRLSWALNALVAHPVPAANKPVQELRDFWLSLPQLDGKGPRHISTLCDRVLAKR